MESRWPLLLELWPSLATIHRLYLRFHLTFLTLYPVLEEASRLLIAWATLNLTLLLSILPSRASWRAKVRATQVRALLGEIDHLSKCWTAFLKILKARTRSFISDLPALHKRSSKRAVTHIFQIASVCHHQNRNSRFICQRNWTIASFNAHKQSWSESRKERQNRASFRVMNGNCIGTKRCFSERVPNCQKCGQHGKKSRLKGHKRVCPFRECDCVKVGNLWAKLFKLPCFFRNTVVVESF